MFKIQQGHTLNCTIKTEKTGDQQSALISNMAAVHIRCGKTSKYKVLGGSVQLLIVNLFL